MALNKRIGLGFLLAVDVAGGTNFVDLGAIVDGWAEAEAKADMVDTSVLVDVVKTKSKSQVDPGELTMQIAYDPDEATSTILAALLVNMSAVPPNWRVTLPGGTLGAGSTTTKTFYAHMSGMGREVKKDGLLVAPITITKTGTTGL